METAIGSLRRDALRREETKENHRVIIALDATNLHSDYYQDYIDSFLYRASQTDRGPEDKSLRDKIGFATVEEIIAAAQTPPTPSQSSPPRPYRV